jgi:DNA-binding transcriptional LysR family regulator
VVLENLISLEFGLISRHPASLFATFPARQVLMEQGVALRAKEIALHPFIDPIAHGPVLNRASMLIDAAVDGQGVALASTTLAAWDIINGRLIRPFEVSLAMPNTYWIVCPKVTSKTPKIATFRNWLLAEAAEDARRLEALASATVDDIAKEQAAT